MIFKFKKKNKDLDSVKDTVAQDGKTDENAKAELIAAKTHLPEDLKAFEDDLEAKGETLDSDLVANNYHLAKSTNEIEPDVTSSDEALEKPINEETKVGPEETKPATKPEKKETGKYQFTQEKSANDEDWLDNDYEEGELAVDVYQDKDNVYIKSTIAGVNSDDVDISLHNDMLTIRGKRTQEEKIEEDNYFYQECYWGSFSRSIILPVEVKAEKIDAFLKNGILTIVLPKVKKVLAPKIKIKEK